MIPAIGSIHLFKQKKDRGSRIRNDDVSEAVVPVIAPAFDPVLQFSNSRKSDPAHLRHQGIEMVVKKRG